MKTGVRGFSGQAMVLLKSNSMRWQRSCFVGEAKAAALLMVVLLSGAVFPVATSSTGSLGINYGMVANNLPPPTEVARLFRSMAITKTRIYSANSYVLEVFGNTGISFIVGIGNEDVASLTDPANASYWVKQRIQPYVSNTHITGIAVGNEVFSGNNTELMSQVLLAMQSLQSAIVSLDMEEKIIISTPHSLAILSTSYPPSAGAFQPTLASYMKTLLEFLSQTGSPFMVNAYPYFAYKSNPASVSLDYVLFRSNVGMTDPN
eukprot:c21047_g2_i2 orf=275-1060(+)